MGFMAIKYKENGLFVINTSSHYIRNKTLAELYFTEFIVSPPRIRLHGPGEK